MKDNLEHIDDFFKSNQNPEQKKQFETRIAEDPEFAEDVAFYLSAMKSGKDAVSEERRKRFKKIYEQNQNASKASKTTPVRRFWPYLAAAAIVCGLLFGRYLFLKPATPQLLADRYINEKFKKLPLNMEAKTDNLQVSLSLYNEGKFREALQQLEKVITLDSTSLAAKENAGIVSLRLKEYNKALIYFQQLENYPGAHSNPGKFYHALTLLKRNQPGDIQEARILLVQVRDENLEGKETAKEWLDSSW
jgi:tetratricopeptide (TPR) repeat protein